MKTLAVWLTKGQSKMQSDYKRKQISTGPLVGAIISAIVLSAFSAQGQQCPEISLQQCDVPGYLETPCGQQQMQECSRLIADAFGAMYDNIPNEHVNTLPDSMGGNREVTRFVPY